MAFKPRTPGTQDGPRVWNSQLVRFACYENPDSSTMGDPSNLDFTNMVIQEYGWVPPEPRGMFDVLPLLLQVSPEQRPTMFEYPPWYVSMVSLQHQDKPWLADMNLKWCSIPIVSAMELRLGGLEYTAIPFSGWCAPDHLATKGFDHEQKVPNIHTAHTQSHCPHSQQRCAPDILTTKGFDQKQVNVDPWVRS